MIWRRAPAYDVTVTSVTDPSDQLFVVPLTTDTVDNDADTLIDRSGVHDEWRDILQSALTGLQPDYLQSLLNDDKWLPGSQRQERR